MSDVENLDAMLLVGSFQGNDQIIDENVSNADFDLQSRGQQRETNTKEGNIS